jgi:hypothetical protein
MFEKEHSIGAAQLEAEGLEGVFNIAKLIAELASQMAQRDIQVEDLVIQTDRGTLKPGMDPADAQQFEADIRDVFMDPENKKAFRVFMEDPNGNRTLIFESKEGKIAPDLYDLRRNMMQFYAKSDAEQFGQNFDEYFDEVVIKTGSVEEQAQAIASDGPTPEIDPRNATIDTEATAGTVSHFGPNAESMFTQAEAASAPAVDLPLPSFGSVTSAEPPPRVDLSDPNSITVESSDIQLTMFPPQTQQEKNEAFINQAIAANAASQTNRSIDENLRTAENLATEYSDVQGIEGVDTFLQDVQQLGEKIAEIQSQMNATVDGSIALALTGANELEGWGEAIQGTLAPDLPNIGDRLQALSQQLVEYIRERAAQDLSILKDAVSDKFSDTMESVVDFVHTQIDNAEITLLGGELAINNAIDSLVDQFGENGILDCDTYTLDANDHTVTRKEDNEPIYVNGAISSLASKEDRQALKDIPAIAKEQSQASVTQNAGASIKR